MIRGHRAAALAWLLLASGCTRAATFPTSVSFPATPRQPPTFAAEPDAQPTSAGGAASVGGAEDASLRPVLMPLDSDAAREVVGRFFVAVLAESSRELFPLLSPQAVVLSDGNRQPAQAAWRARFAQLDYTSLSGRVVGAPQSLRTYTYASAARARRDGVLTPDAPSEVVVVARLALSWSGKTRLFGDELAFRLRAKPSEPRYEIAEIAEDFRLP